MVVYVCVLVWVYGQRQDTDLGNLRAALHTYLLALPVILLIGLRSRRAAATGGVAVANQRRWVVSFFRTFETQFYLAMPRYILPHAPENDE